MCNALSPEKAVIWSILHGEPTDPVSCDTFRYAPYRLWFEAVAALHTRGHVLNFENIQNELSRNAVSMSPRDARALKRMLKNVPPPRIRDNAQAFIRALSDIQTGATVQLHRFIN